MQLNPTIKGAFKAPPLTKVAILSPSSDLIDPKKLYFPESYPPFWISGNIPLIGTQTKMDDSILFPTKSSYIFW